MCFVVYCAFVLIINFLCNIFQFLCSLSNFSFVISYFPSLILLFVLYLPVFTFPFTIITSLLRSRSLSLSFIVFYFPFFVHLSLYASCYRLVLPVSSFIVHVFTALCLLLSPLLFYFLSLYCCILFLSLLFVLLSRVLFCCVSLYFFSGFIPSFVLFPLYQCLFLDVCLSSLSFGSFFFF